MTQTAGFKLVQIWVVIQPSGEDFTCNGSAHCLRMSEALPEFCGSARTIGDANGRSVFANILRSGAAGDGPNERERAILDITPRPHLEPPPQTGRDGTNSPPPLPYLARNRPIWFKYLIDRCNPDACWLKDGKMVILGNELFAYPQYVTAINNARDAWNQDPDNRELISLFPGEAGPVDVNNLDENKRNTLSRLMVGAFGVTAQVLGFDITGSTFPVMTLGYSIWNAIKLFQRHVGRHQPSPRLERLYRTVNTLTKTVIDVLHHRMERMRGSTDEDLDRRLRQRIERFKELIEADLAQAGRVFYSRASDLEKHSMLRSVIEHLTCVEGEMLRDLYFEERDRSVKMQIQDKFEEVSSQLQDMAPREPYERRARAGRQDSGGDQQENMVNEDSTTNASLHSDGGYSGHQRRTPSTSGRGRSAPRRTGTSDHGSVSSVSSRGSRGFEREVSNLIRHFEQLQDDVQSTDELYVYVEEDYPLSD